MNTEFRVSFFRRSLSLVALFTGLFVLTACPPPKWPICKKSEHCKANKKDNPNQKDYFCINGKCLECRNVNDCPNPSKQKCEGNACVDKTCADISCPNGKRCNSGSLSCEWICENDGDSPCDGDRCKVCRNHQCVPKQPKCTDDAGCPAGQICRPAGDCEARCIPGCSASKGCPAGQECVGSTCRKKSCTPEKIYFDFNRSFIRSDAKEALRRNVTCFQKITDKKILIVGHCDERGTREFNMQLGKRRVRAAKRFISGLGISSSRICTVSKGKEDPVVPNASTDEEHQKNRRAVFSFVESCP